MKGIAIIMLLCLLLEAGDLKEYYQLKSLKLEDSACLEEERYCFNQTLLYPTLEILDKKKIKPLEKYIQKSKKDFLKESAKEFIKGVSRDEFIGEFWYQKNKISLYNYIDGFLTIKEEYESYTGGAHGSYGVGFKNYFQGKKIALKDLYGDNKEHFEALAQAVYKEEKGLYLYESLEEDGWFQNSFVLSENFALNDDAIVFLYNPYEIKSFAAGITTFSIPYYRLKKFLDKSSILYPLVQKSKRATLLTKEFALLGGKLIVIFDIKKKIATVKVNLNKDYKRVWLSISMPQFKSKKEVILLSQEGFSSYKSYDSSNTIYNKKFKKAINAKYLLVEAEVKNFKSYNDHLIKFKINKAINKLYLNVRVTAKENRKIINLLEENYINKEDQQGFFVQRAIFSLE